MRLLSEFESFADPRDEELDLASAGDGLATPITAGLPNSGLMSVS